MVARLFQTTLDQDPFSPYWALRDKFEQLRQEGKNQETTVVGQQLNSLFAVNLTNLVEQISASGRRAVFIFDTFEKVKDNLVGSRLLTEWLPRLKPAVVVLSGRQEKGEIEFPPEIADFVVDAPVGNFTRDEAVKYLEERKIWSAVDEDGVADTLFDLTGRRPLLLALSADWIYEHTSFGSISPRNLVEGVDREGFEQKLVEHLPRLDEIPYPEREILPYMAHIQRPFDARLLSYLRPELSKGEAETILKNLSELSFIKERRDGDSKLYWFQDELRRLFQKYIFKTDPLRWDDIQRAVSQKMLTYYNERIQEAAEKGDSRSLQVRTANQLYHEIYLDPQAGFAKYLSLYQATRRDSEIGFLSILVETVRYALETLNVLNEEQIFEFRVGESRWLRDAGNAKLAQKRGLELLAEYKDNPERAAYIYNALGGSTERLGQMQQALDYYGRSFDLSKQLGMNHRLAREEANMGEIHRVLGNQQTAIVHFKSAYNLAMEHNRDDKPLVAKALLELGYTYGLVGQPEVGLDYCDEAVEILQATNHTQQLARSLVLRGAVHRLDGNYEQSIADIQVAINVYTSANRHGLANAYFHAGFTEWFQGHRTGNQNLIKRAEESLNTSISLAKEFNAATLPNALNQIANVYWALGKRVEARAANERAYKLALEQNDIRYAIDSLLAYAEFDCAEGKYDKIQYYAHELKAQFEDKGYYFPLFYGRMKRIQGDVAFEQKDYVQAADFYAEGLYLIAQHGGYAMYGIDQERNNLAEKLKSLSPDDALQICQILKAYWEQKELDKRNPKMLSWVDRLIGRLSFRL